MTENSTTDDMQKMQAQVDAELDGADAEPLPEQPAETPPAEDEQAPDDKLTKTDAGKGSFQVMEAGGKVVLAFKEPTAWVGMSAEQAQVLAKHLYKRAKKVIAKRIIVVPG